MLIILEGMSTSGKTMLQKALGRILNKEHIKYRMVNLIEGLPLETFSHLDSQKSINFLLDFLKSCKNKNEVIICDRLHLSHMAMTNGSDEDLERIESALLKCDSLLVQLKFDEKQAKERLEGAIRYRGDQWVEALSTRGSDRDAAVKWHIGTQKKHLDLYEKSKLPKVLYDTTRSNFQEIAEEILDKYIKPRILQ